MNNPSIHTDAQPTKEVTFIQSDLPPLKTGEYTIHVAQQVNQQNEPFVTSKRFAVAGARFAFKPDVYHSLFPQNHANGEFDGVFAQVVFQRRTLPWERSVTADDETATWLAILLFDADQQPVIVKRQAKDLVPSGQTITVAGSSITGTGTMPASVYSYPGLDTLDYGELPDDECNTIDIPLAQFLQVAPTLGDLPYLAHIRQTDTIDKATQADEATTDYAVVLGNRIPKLNQTSHAYLVSLENMGAMLPTDGGNNPHDAAIDAVRLLVYKSWQFTVNDDEQSFKQLLENLNQTQSGYHPTTSIQLPIQAPVPSAQEVQSALAAQSQGQLTDAQAQVLLKNAMNMGYVPMNHALRHAGNTISCYRGPLLPYPTQAQLQVPISCPDAVNRYNPQTGLFDTSYGAAWQLGQLMALQNTGFATALYNWKKKQNLNQIAQAEQQLLADMMQGSSLFQAVFSQGQQALAEQQAELPAVITDWLAKLYLLEGVPFNYLVPDEAMLPVESMRFFQLDVNWVTALLDGAFSIGRTTSGESQQDELHFKRVLQAARQSAQRKRQQHQQVDSSTTAEVLTGFVMRSAVLSGWPALEVNGYADEDGQTELPKRRMSRLSDQVLFCVFEGVVKLVAVHEPPEALHTGVERDGEGYSTTLRQVNGPEPGHQYPNESVQVSMRSDQQTLQVQKTAGDLLARLNQPPFNEGINQFTSAEYVLEMIKGVVKVEFKQTGNDS